MTQTNPVQPVEKIVIHSMPIETIQAYGWSHHRYEYVVSFLNIFNKIFDDYYQKASPRLETHKLIMSKDKNGLLVLDLLPNKRLLSRSKNFTMSDELHRDVKKLSEYLEVFRKFSGIPSLQQFKEHSFKIAYSIYFFPANCFKMLSLEDIPRGSREEFLNPSVQIPPSSGEWVCAMAMVNYEGEKKAFFENATFLEKQKFVNEEREWFQSLEKAFGKDTMQSLRDIRKRIEEIE